MTTKVRVKEYPVMGAMLVHGMVATTVGIVAAITVFDSSTWALAGAWPFGLAVALASGWILGKKYPRDV